MWAKKAHPIPFCHFPLDSSRRSVWFILNARRSSFSTHVRADPGLSDSPTAASFIRPTRSSDKPLSFLDALRKKYASSDSNDGTALSEEQINISGKTVEEVGFEKIRQQQATLQELRIVILDGLCIASVERQDEARMLDESLEIRAQGLRIVELDLSGNLLEEWTHVVCICSAVGKTLRVLKLE